MFRLVCSEVTIEVPVHYFVEGGLLKQKPYLRMTQFKHDGLVSHCFCAHTPDELFDYIDRQLKVGFVLPSQLPDLSEALRVFEECKSRFFF